MCLLRALFCAIPKKNRNQVKAFTKNIAYMKNTKKTSHSKVQQGWASWKCCGYVLIMYGVFCIVGRIFKQFSQRSNFKTSKNLCKL